MKLRFIGSNGSMGLRFGEIYRLSLEPWRNGILITRPIACQYDSQESFWRNWAVPDENLRSAMRSRGQILSQNDISDELPLWSCFRSEIHGSHNWQTLSTEKPYAWCPGKTNKE